VVDHPRPTRLKRGSHRRVKCSSCGRVGTVRVEGTFDDQVKLVDKIRHDDECPYKQAEQPTHLKKRGWRKQERRVNELLSTRATPVSGALNEDGDGRSFHGLRSECKQTGSGKYQLRQPVWSKLVNGALAAGEEPILHIEYTGAGTPLRVVVIRRSWWDAATSEPISQVGTGTIRPDPLGRPVAIDRLDPPAVAMPEHRFLQLHEQDEM
jgi:hypothetical protein